jgi:radical SAM-linked protein
MEQILRAIRQSGIPVLYSEGHSPRPRVGFSPACPTGIESRAEYFEVECAGFPDGPTYVERISSLLPQGLFVIDSEDVPWKGPAFSEQLRSTRYAVDLADGADLRACREATERLRGSDRVFVRVLRKRKARLMDAKQSLVDASLAGQRLQIDIAFGRRGTLKIAEAIALVAGRSALAGARVLKESVVLEARPRPSAEPEPVPSDAGPVLDLTDVVDRRSGKPASRLPGPVGLPAE